MGWSRIPEDAGLKRVLECQGCAVGIEVAGGGLSHKGAFVVLVIVIARHALTSTAASGV
jgi:hypothetical protein